MALRSHVSPVQAYPDQKALVQRSSSPVRRTLATWPITHFFHVRVQSVGDQHVPMDPVRLSSQEGFQVDFLFPVIELFGWVQLPRGEGFVPVVVLVAKFSREGFFFPGLLRVAAFVASPGPEMILRLMSVRRCRMPHQRSRIPAHGCSRITASVHVPGFFS